ncbi:hypothetical protein H4W81_007396 [Nonomuraea africana]|uniref:RNA-binding protein n=1 Tax=Nonomuraea africana TaxID=46171 RepID=A0ABR9KRG3_9ACTN|nr:hypothetical protein [Nonomuraea africana]
MTNHETLQNVLDQVVAEGVPDTVVEIKDENGAPARGR